MEEWDPKNWNKNIWADPDATGDTELLNSGGSSLPVEVATLSPSEKVNYALPEEPLLK